MSNVDIGGSDQFGDAGVIADTGDHSTASFDRGRSVVTITNDDGSTTTLDVSPTGEVVRTLHHVDPSTGAEVTVTKAANGTITRETTLQNGDSFVVVQHADRTTERIEIIHHDDGSSNAVHTRPDGTVVMTASSMDADGTAREVRTLPDGTTETRIFRLSTTPEGDTVTETSGPEGRRRLVESADGTSSSDQFVHPDGRIDRSDTVTQSDGTRVTTHRLPDGGTEVTRVSTDQFGEEITLVDHPDGTQTRSSVMHLTHPDGSHATVTRGPDGLTHRVEHPDGTTSVKHIFPDKTFEQTTTTTRDDGTVVTESRDRFGITETIQQRVEAGRFTTDITRSDGSNAHHVIGTDSSVKSVTDSALGDRFETTMGPDGSGSVRVTLISNGTVITERAIEPDPEPSRGADPDLDIPILAPGEVADGNPDPGNVIVPSDDATQSDPSAIDPTTDPVDPTDEVAVDDPELDTVEPVVVQASDADILLEVEADADAPVLEEPVLAEPVLAEPWDEDLVVAVDDDAETAFIEASETDEYAEPVDAALTEPEVGTYQDAQALEFGE
jgi:hypothetical protein